ncbi:MAG: dienelactone hydrolase family protein [Elusimicrobia bacterium]|nr:dienelactone hydrolase family protein [Elusimicrobiota bacterium]
MTSNTSAIHFETLEYKDESTSCEGTIVYDIHAQGRLPGVLLCPTFWGNDALARRKAMQLTRLGYTVLVLDPYGGGRIAADQAEAGRLMNTLLADRAVLRRRAMAGLKALRYHRRADGSHLAAVGYCFGGLVALELARMGSDLRGAVSFHGLLDNGGAKPPAAIDTRILALHGADDPFVPPAQAAAFIEEMRAAKADWQLVHYGGAVHAFTNPDAGNDPSTGLAYNEPADQRSWKLMSSFLQECFTER